MKVSFDLEKDGNLINYDAEVTAEFGIAEISTLRGIKKESVVRDMQIHDVVDEDGLTVVVTPEMEKAIYFAVEGEVPCILC